jgi:hypothetical protein
MRSVHIEVEACQFPSNNESAPFRALRHTLPTRALLRRSGL